MPHRYPFRGVFLLAKFRFFQNLGKGGVRMRARGAAAGPLTTHLLIWSEMGHRVLDGRLVLAVRLVSRCAEPCARSVLWSREALGF
jgi:hypothetical protein